MLYHRGMIEIIKQACKEVGGPKALAELLEVRRQSLYLWDRVPAERVLSIEKVTDGKIPRHKMRPDLYPPEDYA